MFCVKSSSPIVKLFIAFTFLFLVSSQTNAQGNLLITPKRVVFDGAKRSEDLNLANTGKDTATYMISFIQIRMKEDGTFEKIESPDSAQQFADPFLRIFPRQVTLAPNEAQTVKLQLRKSSDMKVGEYRSHIYFRAVPKEKPLGDATSDQDSAAISVKLTPIFGISIPVIIRVGETEAQVQVEDVALQTDNETGPVAKLLFNRLGNMSVYGDIAVNHIAADGKVTKVGIAKGFAIYTPNAARRFNLTLEPSAGVDLHKGKLQVVYTDQSPKPVVLAEKEITLQ